MSQYSVSKAMLGGLLGTLGQMLLVYGVAPLGSGPLCLRPPRRGQAQIRG